MIQLKELINEGIITPSMAEIIFSRDEQTQQNRLSHTSLIHTAYRICLIYSSIIQAYIVGKAIYKGVTVDCMNYKKISHRILQFWDTSSCESFNEMSAFSILFDASDEGQGELFSENAGEWLGLIRNEYARYTNKNIRYFHKLTDEQFKGFLSSLPLLGNTEILTDDYKFSFTTSDDSFCIRCSPFITYWDKERATTVEKQTDCLCVLVAVKKGSNASELRTDIAMLDNTSKLGIKTVRYSSNNEHLRMICNAVKHPIEINAADGGVCNLAFLQTLTETSSNVMEEFWKKHDKIRPGRSIAPNLRQMFVHTELYSAINENDDISISELDNTFYGLFIKYGIFKTVYSLLLNTSDWKWGDELFDTYISHLPNITDESKEKCKAECDSQIYEHLEKLKRIVPVGTAAYNLRSCSIKAEWMASCILKATGMQAQKLFAEEENVRSINDFYYMIRNSSTKLTEDLRDVLMLLISFYKALLASHIPFDQERFRRNLWNTRATLRALPIEKLFELFKKTVKDSENPENNDVLEQLVGRSSICDYDTLCDVTDRVLGELERIHEQRERERRRVFISYAHEDKEVVRRISEKWREHGIDLYIDDGELELGDNWQYEVKKAITSPDCRLVVLFLSHKAILKNAVSWEVKLARDTAVDKFKGDTTRQNRFLTVVNLEDDELNDYLEKATLFKGENNVGLTQEQQRFAQTISENILGCELYSNYTKPEDMEKLEDAIKKALTVHDDGEEVITDRPYNDLELEVANFYAFLKIGASNYRWSDENEIDDFFKSTPPNGCECIFPLVTSVKETKIKRDNVTLMGYEIIGSKETQERGTNYILSPKRLIPDDYYCLPNGRTTAKDCSWMIEPFLLSCELFIREPKEEQI